jgi:hypothetical protein
VCAGHGSSIPLINTYAHLLHNQCMSLLLVKGWNTLCKGLVFDRPPMACSKVSEVLIFNFFHLNMP